MTLRYSRHATEQMDRRGISKAAVETAVRYGRFWRAQGARKYRIDRGAIRKAKPRGPDLRQFEGVTVVVSAAVDRVVTVYRNKGGEKVWNR
jgi:hypothetical protein